MVQRLFAWIVALGFLLQSPGQPPRTSTEEIPSRLPAAPIGREAPDIAKSSSRPEVAAPAIADETSRALLDRWEGLEYSPYADGLRRISARGDASVMDFEGWKSFHASFECNWDATKDPPEISIQCADAAFLEKLRPHLEQAFFDRLRPRGWRVEFAGCKLSAQRNVDGLVEVRVEGVSAKRVHALTFNENGVPTRFQSSEPGLDGRPDARRETRLQYDLIDGKYLLSEANTPLQKPEDEPGGSKLEAKYDYKPRRGFYLLKDYSASLVSRSTNSIADVSAATVDLHEILIEQTEIAPDGGANDMEAVEDARAVDPGRLDQLGSSNPVTGGDIASITEGKESTEEEARSRASGASLMRPSDRAGIYGIVRSASGAPIVNVRVELFWDNEYDYHASDRTSEAGEYFIALSPDDDSWARTNEGDQELFNESIEIHAGSTDSNSLADDRVLSDGPDFPERLRLPPEAGTRGRCGTCNQWRWDVDMDHGREPNEFHADTRNDGVGRPGQHEMRLEIWGTGSRLASMGEIEAQPGRRLRIDFSLPEERFLRDQVVDTTAHPVPGAHLELLGGVGNVELNYEMHEADADGRFELESTLKVALIRVSAPGFRPRDLVLVPAADSEQIVLEPSESIRLFVTDGSGAPFPGADVEVFLGGELYVRSESDASGLCTFDQLPGDALTVTSTNWIRDVARGARMEVPARLDGDLVLKLLPFASVGGALATTADRPNWLHPDRVRAVPLAASVIGRPLQDGPYFQDGKYAIRGVLPGPYRLLVSSPREDALPRICALAEVDLREGEAREVDFGIPPAELGVLRVLVRDRSGAQIGWPRLALTLPDGMLVTSEIRGDAGGFHESALAAGKYNLRVRALGHQTVESGPFEIATGQRKSLDIRMTPLGCESKSLVDFFRDDAIVTITPSAPSAERAGNAHSKHAFERIVSLRTILSLLEPLLDQRITFAPESVQSSLFDARRPWRLQGKASEILESVLAHYEVRWSVTEFGGLKLDASE